MLFQYIDNRWLSEAEAATGIWHRHRAYVTVAWRFLNDSGYINFGVAPDIVARVMGRPAKRGAVVIVGAGMAGAASFKIIQDRAHDLKVQDITRHCRRSEWPSPPSAAQP